MIKFIVMGAAIAVAGAAGFFGERLLRPKPAPGPEYIAEKEQDTLMFKLPLGNFTMQVPRAQSVLHLVFNIDVYVMGEKAFNETNGAVGRARLRDATVTAIAELAQTDFSFVTPRQNDGTKEKLAEQIVRKLYLDFPMVRTARMNEFIAHISPKE